MNARDRERRFDPAAAARNPLTAALAAMALHAGASLSLGWPTPSVATFLAGIVAVGVALRRVPEAPKALGVLAGLAMFAPALLPPPLFAAYLAAVATSYGPRGDDPLKNVAIALPALTIFVLALAA